MSSARPAIPVESEAPPWNARQRLRGGGAFLAALFFFAPLHAFAQVTVTVSPSAVNLAPNGTQQFTATVTGASDTSVAWTVQEGAAGGSVTGSGLYTAPDQAGLFHLIVTSNADNTKSATATIGLPGFVTWGLNTPRGFDQATLLPGGTILFTGGISPGCASTSAEVYNPVTDRSMNTTGMLVPRCVHTSTLLPNGKVLLAGGQSNGGETATAELYDPVARTFTATGSMTSPRGGHTATLLSNGKVLITGGIYCPTTCNAPFTTAELYDPSTGTFTPTGSMAVPHYGGTATLLTGGNVLIAGGGGGCNPTCTDLNTAEIYNPSSGRFTPTGNMLISGPQQAAAMLPNGDVLFAGSSLASGGTITAEVYSHTTGTFSQTGNMNVARSLVNATSLPNGSVLISGGDAPNSYPTSAEIYDPSSGTFSLTGSTHEPRIYSTATLVPNGTVVIAGGGYATGLTSTEFYNPSTGVFTSHSTFMNVDRTFQASTPLADGRILFTGGLDEHNNNAPSATAEIFDPATGQFTLTGSMTAGRQSHTATLLPNGQVLVVGGLGPPAGTITVIPTAELYDPVKGTFSLTGSPSVPRGSHTATLLPNGKVLVAGGASSAGFEVATATAELYDPASGTFSPTSNMAVTRYGHTSTLLNNGLVLIAGGIEGPPGPLILGPAGELYDSSTGVFTPVGPTISNGGYPFVGSCGGCSNPTFNSVLLPNGQVQVGMGYIFDPTTNVFNAFPGSQTPVFFGLSVLPNGEVLATDGSFLLIDPVSETYSLSQSVPLNRQMPSANLLSTGQVLVVGGTGAYQANFYQPPVTVPGPSVSGVSPNPVTGFTAVPITVTGANFTTTSVVMDDYVPLQTTFVSPTQLTAIFPAQNLMLAGTHPMQVSNIEDPRFAMFNLLVVNPQLQATANGGGINGSTVTFSSANVGTSTSVVVNLTNIGNQPLKIDSLAISGADSADFTFGAATCSPSQGATLAPQASCTVNIQFAPTAAGPFSATLTLNFELPGSPWVASLKGTGVGVPLASVSPQNLTFGNQDIGTASAAQPFTITNIGTGDLTITNLGVSPSQYFTATNGCVGSKLVIGASCTVNVMFTPISAGAIGGAVSVMTNDGLMHVVQLTGTGIGIPMAAIAPLSLAFASQAVGTSSAAQQVIVASTGTAPLLISSMVFSDTADFQMTSNCPASMAPNTNCSLGITFAPTNVGNISGTLIITANDGSPHTIQLSAIGTGFAIAPAAGSSASATVTPGQPATYQLSLSQMNFSGSVTLTCAPVSALPNATCSVSPNPVTLSGTAATPVTVSVTTAPQSGVLLPVSLRRFFLFGAAHFRMGGWLIFLLSALALAAAPFPLRRIPFALAGALLLALMIWGCASRSSSGPVGGTMGTPAGTYQLLVTASSGSASSKITLTLIVR